MCFCLEHVHGISIEKLLLTMILILLDITGIGVARQMLHCHKLLRMCINDFKKLI